MNLSFREARNEAERAAYAAVTVQAFTSSAAAAEAFAARYLDHSTTLVAVDDGTVVGGALIHPVRQWIGGRSVTAGAVAGVCVLPEARGRGVARKLLRATTEMCRERGLALAPLWPSATRLYRGSGWETIQRSRRRMVKTSALAELRGAGRIERSPAHGAVDDLVRRCAPSWDGTIDAPDWWRVANLPDSSALPEHLYEYGWREGDHLSGFVRFRQEQGAGAIDLTVTEWWSESADATAGLARFLGSHGSMHDEVTFVATALPADDDLFRLLPDGDRVVREGAWVPWATRLTDVRAACGARGWSRGHTGRVELAVTDPFREGAEHLVLEVADGRGHVTPGGSGAIQIGIGALSAWYHGALPIDHAVRQGLATAGAADADVMTNLIAPRPVWLSSYF